MSFADFPAYFSERFPELKEKTVLVALSGGADSVALLHLLTQCELTLEAAYVDHRSRLREITSEISLCRDSCDSLNILFHVLHIDTDNGESEGSREADWRRKRYCALTRLAEERGIAAIATAHHRDDVAEGVLLQMLRGGGPRAMAGIHERRDDRVIRPLLPFSHKDLVEWLQKRDITWCEDSSNDDTTHLRNRVRHEILPLLENTLPSLRNHLINLAGALASDEDFIREELAKRAAWIDPYSPTGGIPLNTLRHLPPALRTRWLHSQARRIGLERVSRQQLSLFAQMIETATPRSVNLARRWRLRLVGRTLWLEPPITPAPFDTVLSPSSEIELPIPGWVVVLRSEDEPPTPGALNWLAPTGARMRVRSSNKGESVVEKGHPKRVSTLLARKLPRHLRNAWPLIVVDDTICWIPGVWQGPIVKASQTQRVEVFRR